MKTIQKLQGRERRDQGSKSFAAFSMPELPVVPECTMSGKIRQNESSKGKKTDYKIERIETDKKRRVLTVASVS